MIDKNSLIIISIMSFTQGGGEILPIRLANCLHEQGYSVRIHALSDQEEEFVRKMVNPEIKVFKCHLPIHMAHYILKEKVALIHTHCNCNQLFVSKCMKLFPWIKLIHVATAHGAYEGMSLKEAKRELHKCDRKVNLWTYVADNNKVTFDYVGIPDHKCLKIGNAMERPRVITPLPRIDLGITNEAKLVTVISRAVDKKCWEQSIEVITRARELSNLDIHLVLGGLGPVRDKLQKMGIPSYIHMVGSVSNPCDYYAASDLGMLLSIRECAPLGIIEMYFAEVPLVATDTGDVKAMMSMEDGCTGIVVPLPSNSVIDINESAKAIVRLLTDQNFYNHCIQNIKKHSKNFEFSKVAAQYLEAYQLAEKM